MKKIKYAVFDVGQTIYPFSFKPLDELMQSKTSDLKTYSTGHSVTDYNYNPYMQGLISHSTFIKELCSFCCVKISYESIAPEINHALHLGCGKPFSETISAIKNFKLFGIEVAILSNALPILHDTKIELVNQELAFTSYSLKLLKPNPAIYQALANKLHTPYHQLLFIDDKKDNIKAAKSLGINTILFDRKTILDKIKNYLPQDIASKSAKKTYR